MNDNKYSVLLSVYRKEQAEYLDQALLSMVRQTVAPDEIVIVRDGPLTRELDEVIDTYKTQYPEMIQILTNETNLGLGLALQKGVPACRNELIARMDSDDIARPDRCEKQLKMFAEDPGLVICGGAIREFNTDLDNTSGYRICPSSDAELKQYIKTRCPFNHMTVMYKKSAVLEAGNYQDFLYNEDYLLWIRLYEKGYKFANLPDVLVDVRVNDDLYQRRGGEAYYKSEKGIQDILLHDGIITRTTYLSNVAKRFILQKLMPNALRGFLYKYVIRRKHEETK